MRAKRSELGSFSAVVKPQLFSFSMKPKKPSKNFDFDYFDFEEQITEPNVH